MVKQRTGILLAVVLISTANAASMWCQDTLYAQREEGVRGEIMGSYDYPNTDFQMAGYEPRSENYDLEPFDPFPSSNWNDQDKMNVEKPNKFKKLDWFASWPGPSDSVQEFIKFTFQRRATIYLFVFGSYEDKHETKIPQLAGWTPVGWAKRPSGASGAELKLDSGTKTYEFSLSSMGYMFSKSNVVSGFVPNKAFIKQNVKDLNAAGRFSVFIAESDGTAPRAPTGNVLDGETAMPGKKCPKWLHNKWFVSGFDSADAETITKSFRTYHPQIDPCFFCTYGHEHGSNAPMLVNYWPRYDYMAWKNNQEDESHNGFKDYVFQIGDYMVYLNVHAHTSLSRRFTARYHTNVVVVKPISNLMETYVMLNYKGDYGALVGMKEDGGLVGLTPEDEELRINTAGGRPSFRRQVQCQDPHQTIDYEEWAVIPPCSKTKAWREPKVLIKDPQTILKKLRFREDEVIFVPGNAGIMREFRAENWTISTDYCRFDMPASYSSTGVFYTDPTGMYLRSGPGPNSTYQYIKPGFKVTISGQFEPTDNWLGTFEHLGSGQFRNLNLGIDSSEN